MTSRLALRRRLSSSRGQSLLEFALILPLVVIVVLGVIELGYALFDQHVVTRLAREGSNLISRDVALPEAAAALATMSSQPVNFSSGSKLIFSVLKKGGTTGTTNYNQLILYQRYTYGTLAATSRIGTVGSASFNGPNNEAPNSDTNANLRVTNVPSTIVGAPGGMIYVTEIFSTHQLITPFDRFGFSVPSQLYSIAYF
jgi:Flp pilus assembly protein TadG